MVSRDLSAGQLRYHLQDLSVSVARRLVAVLDAARDAPHGVAAELDAVVAEITDIQRDLAYEMAGPPIGGPNDLSSLSRMLELQRRMLGLLDRLETISVRPITTYLGERQRAALPPRAEFPPHAEWAAPVPERAIPFSNAGHGSALRERMAEQMREPLPAHIPSYAHVAPAAHIPAHGAGAAPFLARAQMSSAAAAGAGRWPHFSPAARWGILPMAICLVSAVLTTTVNHLMQGEPAGIFNAGEQAAKRGDRLDAGGAGPSEAPQGRITVSMEQRETIAPPAKPVETAAVAAAPTAAAPPTFSDRGLDALNPDAPSVAVVATHQNPESARQAFLELKGRFPEILGSSEAELEAVRTQDGTTWHRVSLVPPVPRSEAKDLCKRLRTAGFAGCWVRSRPGQ